jgi:hypothetical protein
MRQIVQDKVAAKKSTVAKSKRRRNEIECLEYYHKFMFSIKKYYRIHTQLLKMIEAKQYTHSLIEKFKNEYVAILSTYCSIAVTDQYPDIWARFTKERDNVTTHITQYKTDIISIKEYIAAHDKVLYDEKQHGISKIKPKRRYRKSKTND